MSDTRADIFASVRALRDQAAHLESIASRLRDTANELETECAGDLELLRGQEITNAVAGLLDDGEAQHYIAIHGILRGAGMIASGVDPQATLLAALSRDDRFEPAGRGVYRYVAARAVSAGG